MSDAALRGAQAKREFLAKEINILQQKIEDFRRELAHVDTFIQDWHSFAEIGNGENGGPPVDAPSISPPSESLGSSAWPKPIPPLRRAPPPPFATAPRPVGRTAGNSKKEDVARIARQLIRANGAPMSRAELYPALVIKGLRIEGTDPDMVLSTMLWRSKDSIIRLPKFGYWLVDEPYEPAGYEPGALVPGDAEHSEMIAKELLGDLPDVGEEEPANAPPP